MTKWEDGYSMGRAAAQQEIITKLLELVKNLEGYTDPRDSTIPDGHPDKYGFKDDDLISSSDGT